MSELTDQVLAEGRALAQALMDSTVRITRVTSKTPNRLTGKIDVTRAVIYDGPARVRAPGSEPRDVDAAGQRFAEQTPTVSLPIAADSRVTEGSSAAVRVDDEGEITANDAAPGAVGTRFRIAGQHEQTHSTARRMPVEVFTHGG